MDTYEAYKSRAHRLYHAFRKSARVNGDLIGTDVTVMSRSTGDN
jgi:hypothetical protein